MGLTDVFVYAARATADRCPMTGVALRLVTKGEGRSC